MTNITNDELASMIARGFQEQNEEMDRRFNEVDKRFDEIDERFGGVDTRFEGIEDRLDDMNVRLSGVEVTVTATRSDIRTLFSGADETKKRVEKLEINAFGSVQAA